MKPLSDIEFAKLLKSRCIGLTGGIATGKSTVAEILRREGYIVIDADQLARAVTMPGESALREIVKRFGPTVLDAENKLNRNLLRSVVMSDAAERKALEAITHPAIQKKFKEQVESSHITNGNEPFFYEAALLFETSRDDFFKEVWVTLCPESLQMKRLQERSGLSDVESRKILASQMPASLKAQKATRILDTNCTLDELKSRVTNLLETVR